MRPALEIVTMVRNYVDLSTFLLAMSTCLLIYLYLRRPKNLPPGPLALPLIGNMYKFVGARFLPARCIEVANTYGDVWSLWGIYHTVVLNGYSTIREALVKKSDHFSSRLKDPYTASFRGGKDSPLGILFAVGGPVWRHQRKFALKTLRNFGVGKRSMEAKISEEAEALNRDIVTRDCRPFDIKNLLHNAASNIICSVTFGTRFDYGDPEFLRLLDMLEGAVNAKPMKDLFPKILPMFRYYPFFAPEHGKAKYCFQQIQSFCTEQIARNMATFDPDNIRDFIDAFILEQEKAGTDDKQEGFTENQLREVLVDLFLAGTETSATTLRWALVYMMANPAIQEKVHGEIDAVLGQAVPMYALRDKMPYTTATLAEVQRINTVAPLAIPHTTSRDTTLRGYSIPANTMVLPNLWSVHMDPELFPEPDNFNPDRFLDQDGNFVKHEALIPFSVGPRVCLGEQLARMEVFLLFVSMMQRFTFHLPEGAPGPSLVGQLGFLINAPHPFDLCAVPRG